MSKPKICFFDIETLPIVGYFWQLRIEGYLSHENIVEDWTICCASWKFLGEKTQSIQVKKIGDDKELVKKLRDVLAQADILVGHNLDKFDVRKLNARIIEHGLEPLPLIPTVDTKKQAKEIGAFTSNRMDYLAQRFLGIGKLETDFKLWKRVKEGDKAALAYMVKYNKADVDINVKVYNRLLPYMKQHPHMGAMDGKARLDSCPKCGSDDLKKNGIRYTATGLKRQEYQCRKCHGFVKVPFKA
jgi:DNA polymerase elongation subunit (family B)